MPLEKTGVMLMLTRWSASSCGGTKPPKKPELTDKEISQIREALKEEPEWMQVAFDIALHTGCRLRETHLPMNCTVYLLCDWVSSATSISISLPPAE